MSDHPLMPRSLGLWLFCTCLVGAIFGVLTGIMLAHTGSLQHPRSVAAFALLLIVFFDALALARVANAVSEEEAKRHEFSSDGAKFDADREMFRALLKALGGKAPEALNLFSAEAENVVQKRLAALASGFEALPVSGPGRKRPWFVLPFLWSTAFVVAMAVTLYPSKSSDLERTPMPTVPTANTAVVGFTPQTVPLTPVGGGRARVDRRDRDGHHPERPQSSG
jgi:hypothetical protein